jgi:hypothetical protein
MVPGKKGKMGFFRNPSFVLKDGFFKKIGSKNGKDGSLKTHLAGQKMGF